MGVYIKNMEMPLEKSRIIQIYPDGTVRRLDGSIYNSHFEAVPAPKHGRLIDADALEVSLAFAEKTAEWAVPALRAVLMVIDETPTIIEAEEGE